MRRKRIEGSELDVSAICLGTFVVGTSLDETESSRLLDAYVHEGGNFIDTANVYGKWLEGGTSRSEAAIGKWMKARRNRENLVIGTKGAHPDMRTLHIPRLSPADIAEDVEESLRNLQTDYIDLYWLHRDDIERPVGDILETLHTLARAGKIRYYGCSNWTAERIEQARQYAERSGVQGFVANQNMWNLAEANPGQFAYPGLEVMDEASLNYHERTGMTAIPYTSQANGFFSKALRDDFAANPAYDKLKRQYVNERTLARVEHVRELAEQTGWEATQIALAYLICQKIPTIPIVGPKNEAQLRDSLKALDLELSDRTVEELRSGLRIKRDSEET